MRDYILGYPRVGAVKNAVGNGAHLQKAGHGVSLQDQRLELRVLDASPGTSVGVV